jgi:hypothetical protein
MAAYKVEDKSSGINGCFSNPVATGFEMSSAMAKRGLV